MISSGLPLSKLLLTFQRTYKMILLLRDRTNQVIARFNDVVGYELPPKDERKDENWVEVLYADHARSCLKIDIEDVKTQEIT